MWVCAYSCRRLRERSAAPGQPAVLGLRGSRRRAAAGSCPAGSRGRRGGPDWGAGRCCVPGGSDCGAGADVSCSSLKASWPLSAALRVLGCGLRRVPSGWVQRGERASSRNVLSAGNPERIDVSNVSMVLLSDSLKNQMERGEVGKSCPTQKAHGHE